VGVLCAGVGGVLGHGGVESKEEWGGEGEICGVG
jgi:hypothetical protein